MRSVSGSIKDRGGLIFSDLDSPYYILYHFKSGRPSVQLWGVQKPMDRGKIK